MNVVTSVKPYQIYYFHPTGDIDVAPYVPRGIHRVSEISTSEAGREVFRVFGGTRWHSCDMFDIEVIKGDW